jgi:uncharacterized hydrophobic protein (TIGR00271 family)
MGYFKDILDLRQGEDDKQKTIESIQSSLILKGSNLWILACAIIVASVGLNVNSSAVIIGAMLISPLMGPILGTGFALGIYDFTLLKTSLRNLLIATIVSLVVSTIYFYISPFKEVQSEILARVSPNIYDILIAFFGGLVGVITITRVEKGNPLPGVAIATALMPPLCTAGFGLATGNWRFFAGALFLYSINCVFICIATFLIIKYLNYPAKVTDPKRQKLVKYSVSAIVIVMLIPSSYFAYSLYCKQRFMQRADQFIDKEFIQKGNTVIYKRKIYNTNPKVIEMAFLLKRFDRTEINTLDSDLINFGLTNTKLIIRQDSTDHIQNLRSSLLNEVNSKDIASEEKDATIKALQSQIAKTDFNNKEIQKEAKILFPSITELSVANHTFYDKDDTPVIRTILIYKGNKELKKDEKQKLSIWLSQKLSIKGIDIYKE